MNFRKSHPKKELQLLLEHGRVVPSIPASVRARVMARARSTAQPTPSALSDGAPASRHRGSAIALAAAMAFIVGAAGATIAFRARSHNEQHMAPPANPHVESAACAAPSVAPLPVETPAPQPSIEQKTVRPAASMTARESYTAELGLLQRAQAAYADHNFATTLLVVSEHARRFPNGRLTEEREALRVKALLGAGRESEARKAASTFASRFPRSALLPRLNNDGTSGK